MQIIPLQLVKPGTTAHVECVRGDDATVRRLQEMGLCPGCKLKVVCQGSGCIVKLCGSKLCFRNNEATSIFVSVGSPA